MGFPKIHQLNDTRDFCEGLARRYETLVVPGHFFAEPAHIRLGFGAPVDELEAGLEQLGRALDELRHARLE